MVTHIQQSPSFPNLPSDTETDVLSARKLDMLGQRVVGIVEQYPRITDRDEKKEALGHLRSHLIDIAGDSRGSDPKDYVTEEHLEFLGQLFNAASRHMDPPWKDATPITHVETTPHWLPRQKKSDRVLDKEKRPVKGYRVGYLNVAQFEAPVFFCSDGTYGTLRMLIKHSDTKARGLRGTYDSKSFSGYCRLPDPELLYPVRTRGTMSGVSYKHGQTNTLKTELKTITGFTFN
jgi:hypothetical protein